MLLNSLRIPDIAIEKTSLEMWRRTLGINLDGTFLGCRAAVREMRTGGGSIVNLSSSSGLVGDPDSPAYDASKGGVRLLTKSVALHCARAMGFAVTRSILLALTPRWPKPISPPRVIQR